MHKTQRCDLKVHIDTLIWWHHQYTSLQGDIRKYMFCDILGLGMARADTQDLVDDTQFAKTQY